MRLKAEAVLEFGLDDDQRQNKIVREYRNQYKVIGEILDNHPKILEMAHRDLAKLSKATSRRIPRHTNPGTVPQLLRRNTLSCIPGSCIIGTRGVLRDVAPTELPLPHSLQPLCAKA